MSEYEAQIAALRHAANAARSAGEQVSGVDLAGAIAEAGTALPGAQTARSFTTLGNAWRGDLACALAVALTGCGSGEPKGDAMNAQFAELRKRPDIEQAESAYQGMLTEIRDRLVREVGIAAWQPPGEPVSASGYVGDLSAIGRDGEIRRYSSGISPGNLPDAEWARAVALVRETAQRQGFGEPAVVGDRPGDHEVSFPHPSCTELLFGTAANTTLSLSTGCHLTAEAHRRRSASRTVPRHALGENPGEHLSWDEGTALAAVVEFVPDPMWTHPAPPHRLGQQRGHRCEVPHPAARVEQRPVQRRQRQPAPEDRRRKPSGPFHDHVVQGVHLAGMRNEHMHRRVVLGQFGEPLATAGFDAGHHRTRTGVHQGGLHELPPGRRAVGEQHDAR
ncbi:LppA family lipoprotein [Amycolatopsis anabasis]|uniref:LppA family lipoprotein n=1 Tax=Amycolatopsis anabasis TaxID=1840409 RepID=UPI001FE43612|nr:LppA family lipoprotein [Amycolatopsis anabasis]